MQINQANQAFHKVLPENRYIYDYDPELISRRKWIDGHDKQIFCPPNIKIFPHFSSQHWSININKYVTESCFDKTLRGAEVVFIASSFLTLLNRFHRCVSPLPLYAHGTTTVTSSIIHNCQGTQRAENASLTWRQVSSDSPESFF